jgi:hypothetical protein
MFYTTIINSIGIVFNIQKTKNITIEEIFISSSPKFEIIVNERLLCIYSLFMSQFIIFFIQENDICFNAS